MATLHRYKRGHTPRIQKGLKPPTLAWNEIPFVTPTHRRGHTLDWLITNRATDVLDLTVAEMLLSDHFIVSFDLLLRKPGRVTTEPSKNDVGCINGRRRKLRHVTSDLLICMLLGQIFVTFLSVPLSLNQLTPLVCITHVCARRWTIMLLFYSHSD